MNCSAPTVTFENLTCTGGNIQSQQWNRRASAPRHRPHHPQRSDPLPPTNTYAPCAPASSPKYVGTEVRENSHRRKDLLLHPPPAAGEANFFSGKMYEYRLTVTSEGIKNIDMEEGGGTWQPVE